MNYNVSFQSKWFERCIRDYLGLGESEQITQEDLNTIKYLYVGTTHEYVIAFGKDSLPEGFWFEDAGDEWECCCVYNPSRYQCLNEYIKVINWNNGRNVLTLRTEIEQSIQQEIEYANKEQMKQFSNSIKYYYAKNEDMDGLEEDEETCDMGLLIPEDFAYLTGLEAIRFMDCELEIHRMAFLRQLPKLKVLELGAIRLENMEGIEKFKELEALCIWPEYYYQK